MTTSLWILALSFWLHMIATVVWLGGLFLMALVVWPGAARALGCGRELHSLMRTLQRRLIPLGWLSLAVLTATGLIQMAANPNYEGFLNLSNSWTLAILLKHLAVIGMLGVGSYHHFALIPLLERGETLRAAGRDFSEADRLYRREVGVIRVNLGLGVLVLLFTAVARAVGQ